MASWSTRCSTAYALMPGLPLHNPFHINLASSSGLLQNHLGSGHFLHLRTCSSWAGPQRRYLPFSRVVVAAKLGRSGHLCPLILRREHILGVSHGSVSLLSQLLRLKNNPLKESFFLLYHVPSRFCRLTEMFGVWKGRFWSSCSLGLLAHSLYLPASLILAASFWACRGRTLTWKNFD